FGDVVDFDDGHSYLKSSLLRPDCLRIDANVPNGISFLGSGTITVLSPLRNFLWLPFWEIKMKPCRSKILTIALDE
ncbi:MAG: hypothetical protein WAT68_01685, partial [Candidatus Nitrotoga sp.]